MIGIQRIHSFVHSFTEKKYFLYVLRLLQFSVCISHIHNVHCYIPSGGVCWGSELATNYDNAKKCVTDSKAAHVRLLLGQYPQCLSHCQYN